MSDGIMIAADRFNSLGVPVDDLTVDEACDRIFGLVEQGRRDGAARYVATVNVDFLVNAVGHSARRHRHPELLEVLRSADLVTADGFPVVWLSRILGRPIRERVTGADLVPTLARRGAERGLSLFLLGGAGGVGAEAAAKLQEQSPGLRIAGVEAPMIHVTGPELANSIETDAELVDRINASGADVLLLGLGNPKQELWYWRNRRRLKVPVSIGIGGTFSFITGQVRRAPRWIQRTNLEWVYRVTQDPGRLWKRYARGLTELALMVAPIIRLRLREKLLRPLARRRNQTVSYRLLWSSRDSAIQAIQLPATVQPEAITELLETLESTTPTQLNIVDFSRVRHLPLAAFQCVFELGRRFDRGTATGLITGLSNRLEHALRAGRIVDVMEKHVRLGSEALAAAAGETSAGPACRTFTLEQAQLIFLGGDIDAATIDALGIDVCATSARERRPCVVDLRQIRALDSVTAARLAALAARRAAHPIHFSGASREHRDAFRRAGVSEPDWLSDERLLETIFDTGATQ